MTEEHRSLYFLRKRAGLSPQRFVERPNLCTLCGVEKNEPARAVDRVRSCLDALGGTKEAKALRNALAIDVENPGSLEQRRAAYALKVGKGETTVKEWENHAFADLYACLSRYRFRAEVVLRRAKSVVTIRRGLIAHTYESRTVLAQIDGVDEFSYEAGPTAEIVPLDGADWIQLARTDEASAFTAMFSPLKAGQQHTYDFEVLDPIEPSRLPDRIGTFSQRFHVPAIEFELTIRFEDVLPERCWRFQDLPLVVAEDGPLQDELVEVRDSQCVFLFRDLPGNGLPVGIAWRWQRS